MLASVIICILCLIIIILSFSLYCQLSAGVCENSKHLIGKVVIVTGGDSGIGFETALDIAERGARVIIASNNKCRGETAKDEIIAQSGNNDVHFKYIDLLNLDSVRAFASNIISTETRLDILINNAGALFKGYKKSEDGLLNAMQCNYFGPFLLTNLLLPMLIASSPSRIINVSSSGHKLGYINLEDLNMETNKRMVTYFSYFNAKLCIALMTVELSRRLKDTGVTTNFLHPGCSATNIVNYDPVANSLIFKIILFLSKAFVKSPRMGAQTTIYLAVSPNVENISGCYFADCRKEKMSSKAEDAIVAKNLWDISEKLVKLK